MNDLKKYFSDIKNAYLEDQYLLRKKLHQLIVLEDKQKHHPSDSNKTSKNSTKSTFKQQFEQWQEKLSVSLKRVEERQIKLPKITYTEELPVSLSINKIRDVFIKHQVIIVASETGSGKTTQLPKMCLEAGRGIRGKIAHTQPRRIAAISVAGRIASELNSSLGEYIGYKVRFQDTSSDNCYIKLMTDGMLLAEIQQDRFLNQYDTVIIDEAHERSLNIDFLLGFLKKILPKRPDLKVIITSATINTTRFSEFFHHAPVIEVSGKLWPVEVRYHRDDGDIDDELADSSKQNNSPSPIVYKQDINQRIAAAIDELLPEGRGDILIFLTGEKDIRDCIDYLKSYYQTGKSKENILFIPLYARLTAAEQKRIFQTGNQRRIILSTNIAETSITVPGIQFVIDSGTARISRYSVRNKIQLLPIEKISQASAKQRSGRCGRVSAGIAIRLYAEDDFNLRPLFTEAEILRTNLAQVILHMLRLKLGNVQDFDFIDKPQLKNINDGYSLLLQLGAITHKLVNKNPVYRLTPLGHQVAQLNIDPKLAVVLMQSLEQQVLSPVLVIVAALSCQDPREVPKEKQQLAREKHQIYTDKQSDFMSLISIWNDIQQQSKSLSQNKFRKYCYSQFLSFNRLREWQEIVTQLKLQLKNMRVKVPHLSQINLNENEQTDYIGIHKSLLSGLFQFVARKDEKNTYKACRELNLKIHPGSGLVKKQPKWILASEVVETTQVYARKVAYIEPTWVEQQTEHLLKQHYYEPRWDNKIGKVVAKAKLSLFGLVIIPDKQVNFGDVDPVLSHEIFIKEALLTGEYTNFRRQPPPFLRKNLDTIKAIEKLEHKSRRHDILVDDEAIVHFYQSKLESRIYTRASFENWYKKIVKQDPDYLIMNQEDLMHNEADHVSEVLYPGTLNINSIDYQLEYHFLPGHPLDGVTAIIPLGLLNKIHAKDFSRLVPGMIREKVELMFRSLPKVIRRVLLPINEKITEFLQSEVYNDHQFSLDDAFIDYVTTVIASSFNARQAFDSHVIEDLSFPYHLKMNFRLLEEESKPIKSAKKSNSVKKKSSVKKASSHQIELDSSRDLHSLQQEWGEKAEQALLTSFEHSNHQAMEEHSLEKSGLSSWDFGDLPETIKVQKWGNEMLLFPALVDDFLSVSIKLFDTQEKANISMSRGLFRLYFLATKDKVRKIIRDKTNMAMFNRLSLSSSHWAKTEEIISQITGAVIHSLLEPSQLIYQQGVFIQRLADVENQVESEVIELLKLLELIFHHYRDVKKIIKKQTNLTLLAVVNDINQHLSSLFNSQFILTTPKKWLKRYIKYIQVIEKRFEKAIQDPRRDNLLQLEINALEKKYVEFEKSYQTNENFQLHQEQIVEYRWLLEELRLSLFAQELKTIQPISVARMDKLWKQIKTIF